MHCRLPYEGPRRISSNAAAVVIEVAPGPNYGPRARAREKTRKYGSRARCEKDVTLTTQVRVPLVYLPYLVKIAC